MNFWGQHTNFLPAARSKIKELLNPVSEITVPVWQRHWLMKEKARTMIASRVFFTVAIVAYILHFFLVDLPAGKEPIRLWAVYRFGLAGFSVICLALCFSARFCASVYYKIPLILAAFVFSFLQARSMLWSSQTPLFFAFVLPCLTVVILKWNIAASLGLFLAIQAFQYPSFWRAELEPHILTSATMLSMLVIVMFRSNMSADVRSFISAKHQKELRRQLNHYLRESRKKGLALKASNEDLERKAMEFRLLLEASHSLAEHAEMGALFRDAISRLEKLFPESRIGIAYDGGEKSITTFVGKVSDEIRDFLKENNEDLLVEGVFEFRGAPSPFYIVPLAVGGKTPIGKVFMMGTNLNEESYRTLDLFVSTLAGYTQNLTLLKRLEVMAHRDELTQACSRNFFDEKLDEYILQHERNPDSHFSIFLIDVNGLKSVNDNYGHKAGDQLIVSVANLLRGTCRKTDMVGRLGGDEFVILCPETRDASPLLKRIRAKEKISHLDVHVEGAMGADVSIPIRLSIGLSSTCLEKSHMVLKRADELMYEDKRAFYRSA